MTISKNIFLVAVDYSESAVVALDQAIALAHNRTPAVIIPLLVLAGGPATSPESLVVATEELIRQSQQNLRTLVETRLGLAGSSAGIEIEPRVMFGDPAERITECAREASVELIVVGTHGRRGVQHLLLGSVAGEVVTKADCSVLVARSAALRGQAGVVSQELASPLRVDVEALAGASASDWSLKDCVVSEPHLDPEGVVVHVLDRQSGRTFECRFQTFDSVSIESLEREWVTSASGEQRARAAHAALAFSRAEQPLFEQLFLEFARRKATKLG